MAKTQKTDEEGLLDRLEAIEETLAALVERVDALYCAEKETFGRYGEIMRRVSERRVKTG